MLEEGQYAKGTLEKKTIFGVCKRGHNFWGAGFE